MELVWDIYRNYIATFLLERLLLRIAFFGTPFFRERKV